MLKILILRIINYLKKNINQKNQIFWICPLIEESKFLLPEELTKNSWMDWCKSISEKTGVSGKKLFLTLRLKITGLESGPEMNTIICLLGRNEILRRLQ